MAGTGRERPAYRVVNQEVGSGCDAKCDAIPVDRIELLARAVVLVAGMALPETTRQAVLARVIADLNPAAEPPSVAPGATRCCSTLVIQPHASARPTSRYARQTRE